MGSSLLFSFAILFCAFWFPHTLKILSLMPPILTGTRKRFIDMLFNVFLCCPLFLSILISTCPRDNLYPTASNWVSQIVIILSSPYHHRHICIVTIPLAVDKKYYHYSTDNIHATCGLLCFDKNEWYCRYFDFPLKTNKYQMLNQFWVDWHSITSNSRCRMYVHTGHYLYWTLHSVENTLDRG